jgi:dUTP pyrophosphatase
MITYKILTEVCVPRVGEGDAGMDLRTRETFAIWPQETMKIPLGIAFEIPNNRSFVQISARSSVALRGCYVHIGTIDRSFNGKEVCAIMTNLGDAPITFEAGERVAQAVGLDHQTFSKTVNDIDSRDSKEGFGSSGRH